MKKFELFMLVVCLVVMLCEGAFALTYNLTGEYTYDESHNELTIDFDDTGAIGIDYLEGIYAKNAVIYINTKYMVFAQKDDFDDIKEDIYLWERTSTSTTDDIEGTWEISITGLEVEAKLEAGSSENTITLTLSTDSSSDDDSDDESDEEETDSLCFIGTL